MNILNAQHENFKANGVNVDSLIKNIEFYESYIPEFFSSNGEAHGIKEMYNGIRQNLGSEKSIICTDVNQSAHIYREYMEGMISFIRDVSESVFNESADELALYEQKFEKAKQKDSIFIESLYDGKLNEKTEMVLSEAVANVEFLIDFIPELKTMKECCTALHDSFMNVNHNDKKTLLNESLNMLYESVDNYCYSTLMNIVNIYTDIRASLFNETAATVITGPETFALF
jgi:hypothetical protein